MRVTIFTLKKDHRGVKAGAKVVLDKNDTKFEYFYSNSEKSWIKLDLNDSELFEKATAERTKVTSRKYLQLTIKKS